MPSRTLRLVLVGSFMALGVVACSVDEPGGELGLTENPEAMAAFEAANELWTKPGRTAAETDESLDLLEEAIALDPEFAMALSNLAQSHAWIHQNWDRSAERAARTLEAAEQAVSVAPELPEAHAALGAYHYRIAKDYDLALQHYARAQELSPGEASALRMTGYVARRAGRWEQAVELLEQASTISTTRASAWDLGNTYLRMGQFDQARAAYEEARDIAPDHWQPPHALAWLDIHERGDLTALRSILDQAEGGYVGNRFWLAMVDGDWEAALAAMDAPGNDPLSGQYGIVPRSLSRGLAYRRMGDEVRAMEEFEAARQMMESMVAETPDDPRPHLALGLALAALGQAEEAIQAGRAGVELMPRERDAMIGANNMWWMVEIYAAAGDAEAALDELEALLSEARPAGLPTIAMDPWLYTLADHPRFEELLGGA
jgi:tetratricopeptide (TPR) repeat protein